MSIYIDTYVSIFLTSLVVGIPLAPKNETTKYALDKERVCSAKESMCSKISAEDNGDHIFSLLPSWPNYKYDLLQESDHAITSCPHSKKMAGEPRRENGNSTKIMQGHMFRRR